MITQRCMAIRADRTRCSHRARAIHGHSWGVVAVCGHHDRTPPQLYDEGEIALLHLGRELLGAYEDALRRQQGILLSQRANLDQQITGVGRRLRAVEARHQEVAA